MEKVKVTRYVTGKRPDYAPDSSSDEEDEFGIKARTAAQTAVDTEEKDEDDEMRDHRLRRLQYRERGAESEEDEEDRSVKRGIHGKWVWMRLQPELLLRNCLTSTSFFSLSC